MIRNIRKISYENVTAEVAANKNYLYFRHGSNNVLAAIYDVRNVDDIVEAIVDTGICNRFAKTARLSSLYYIKKEFGDIGYTRDELKEVANDLTSTLKVIANLIAIEGYAYFDNIGLYATLGGIGICYARKIAQSRTFPGAVPIESKKAKARKQARRNTTLENN